MTTFSYPYTLVNGVTADASQVMANFAAVQTYAQTISTTFLPLTGGILTGSLTVSVGGGVGVYTASGADGAIIFGSGSSFDMKFENKNGATIAQVVTGTSQMDFVGAPPTFVTTPTSDNSQRGATTAFVKDVVRTGTVSLTAGVGAGITFSPPFATTCDSIALTPIGSFAQARAFSYAAGSVTVVSDTTTNFTWIAVGH